MKTAREWWDDVCRNPTVEEVEARDREVRAAAWREAWQALANRYDDAGAVLKEMAERAERGE